MVNLERQAEELLLSLTKLLASEQVVTQVWDEWSYFDGCRGALMMLTECVQRLEVQKNRLYQDTMMASQEKAVLQEYLKQW